MADTAPVTAYVPKQYTKDQKREFQRRRTMHLKKKAKAAAAQAGK